MTERLPDLPADLEAALERGGDDLSILVLRLGAMGDILRTVPAVRLLRRSLPSARIHWVLEEHWAVLLDGHPDLDGLVTAPRKRWNAMWRSPSRWPGLLGSLRDYRRQLRATAPGLTIDFHGNLRSGLSAGLSGAPVRLGYDGHQQKEGNRRFTTHRVPSEDRRTPRPERNLALLRGLGLAVDPLPGCDLPLVDAGRRSAEEILGRLPLTAAGFAVIAPGASAGQAYKKPPAELLGGACRSLATRGVAVLVVHGPGEEDDARRVVDQAEGGATFAPPTDLPTLAALLHGARLFVGGDTGPMHMACATGCPVVALYGPTDPQVNRPWGVPYRALHPPQRKYTGIKRLDRESGGFEGLGPEMLESALDALLHKPRAST